MIANHVIEIEEQEDGTYVFPVLNYKRARGWHLYVYKDGSADLFLKIGPHGTLLGKPIKLPAPSEKILECETSKDPNCKICEKAFKKQ